jgi:hypothetical protein
MALPTESAENSSARASAHQLDLLMDSIPRSIIERTTAWLKDNPIFRRDSGPFQRDELEHELSRYMTASSTQTFEDGRSLEEMQGLAQAKLPPSSRIHSLGDFLDVLSAIRSQILDGESTFRQSLVASGRDRLGHRVVYPPPRSIPGQLNAIFECWNRHKDQEPAFAGIVAMTALMNLHPYSDGNGRLGRMLFNWTIQRGCQNQLYIPIYEVSAFSNCGYLVRLRLAQYQSKWGPLSSFLLMCCERLCSWR